MLVKPISKINIERPLAYFKCGQFVSDEGWKHKRMKLEKDYEVIIGLKEVIYLQVGDTQYEIKHGDVLLIKPDVEYFGYKASKAGASFFWLHFFPRDLTQTESGDEFISHLFSTLLTEQKNEINRYVCLPDFFSLPYLDKPIILMKQILDTSNTSYYSTYAVDYLVTELMIELTDKYLQPLIHNELLHKEYNQKFMQILEWIRVNIYHDLTVQKVADTFCFNADHLTRLFKKNLGMSTIRYINTLKLSLVKELLCTSNASIKEIAYQLHFRDEKYLMKLFKNYVGMTPTQFRDTYTNTYMNTVTVDPDIPIPKHLLTE
ncbi:AraC family transcriptional regulator [Paenibacillus nuruki]|uniref:AraC family transcriptional regulator n=1 Tax=Paenibacillus nuruki TaxID=1886670 RepID=UPI002804493C|nr:AraC family transcriptional regulator [Paenibacillus nuruki]CAJ1314749.1 Putative HTH-type transcriptional regulator YtdP [Paenibacillus nuruki]